MQERNVNISISIGTVVKTLLVFVGAALVWYLRDIVLILLTAIVIASAMEPGIRGFIRAGLPRVLAVVLMYALIVGVFGAALYFFVPLVLRDAAAFLVHVPDAIRQVAAPTGSASGLPFSNIASQFSSADFITSISGALSGTPGSLFAIVSAFFGGLMSFVLVVVFSFYFSVQETGVDDFLRIVTPARYENYVIGLWRRAQDKIGRWMQGQLLLGLIVGILLFLGLTILQVPYALLLAVTAALFELIPVFGQIIAMIPALVLAFEAGGATFALLVAGLYVLVQQFEAHLIYPLVVRKIVGVPPLLVILSLIVGAKLAGFVGVLLSVPIAAALRELVNDVESRRKHKAPAVE
jgi:predicted PurR-regulated permease PerM